MTAEPLVPPDAFHVYDTTLRDGDQREGLSLSVNDKLAIARHLDDLLVETVRSTFPAHEHDQFVAHYRGLLGAWVSDAAVAR